MTDLFSVWQCFDDDLNECVAEGVEAKAAIAIAHSYTTRPAALMGVIKKVMVTDSGDYCVFLWENGTGVVFPERGPDGRFA